jgi:hypothetical protein
MAIVPPQFDKLDAAWSHGKAPPGKPIYAEPPKENMLGLIGFITSVVGLVFTCGIASPLGLLLSLFGLLSRPRGYALAGVVTGLLGSVWIVLLAGAFWLTMSVAMVAKPAIQQAMVEFAEMSTTVNNMSEAKKQIEAFRTENERLPDGVEGNKIVATFKDSEGNPLRYELKEDTYLIRSAGKDQKFETADDLDSTQLDAYVQGLDELKRAKVDIEKEIEKAQREEEQRRKANSQNAPEIELPEVEIPEAELPKF